MFNIFFVIFTICSRKQHQNNAEQNIFVTFIIFDNIYTRRIYMHRLVSYPLSSKNLIIVNVVIAEWAHKFLGVPNNPTPKLTPGQTKSFAYQTNSVQLWHTYLLTARWIVLTVKFVKSISGMRKLWEGPNSDFPVRVLIVKSNLGRYQLTVV